MQLLFSVDGVRRGHIPRIFFALALCSTGRAFSHNAFPHDLGRGCTARIISLGYVPERDGFRIDRIVMYSEYMGCPPGARVKASLFYEDQNHSEVAGYSDVIDGSGYLRTSEIEHFCTPWDPPVYGVLFGPDGTVLVKSKTVLCKAQVNDPGQDKDTGASGVAPFHL